MINWLTSKFRYKQKKAKYSILSNYIRVYDGIIPNNIIDNIIDYTAKNAGNWVTINRPTDRCLGMRFNLKNQEGLSIDTTMHTLVNKAIGQYLKDCKGISVKSDTGYEIVLHDNNKTEPHFMNLQYMQAQALMFIFLTDHNDKEGSLIFPNQDIIVNAKKGRIVVFPGNFLFPFKALPLINKSKYSIFTMFN